MTHDPVDGQFANLFAQVVKGGRALVHLVANDEQPVISLVSVSILLSYILLS